MAIKGNLEEAALPDVLQLLAMGRKTGCLSVTDRSKFGNIFFNAGNVTHAAIINRRDRLGDLLVKNGLVDSAALQSAVEEQARRPDVRLGEILQEHGEVTLDQVERFVRIQIEEAIYLLFTWRRGSFYFEARAQPPADALLVSLNPENLLLEGARRIDEWSLIEEKIPSLDVIFRSGRDHPVGAGSGLDLSDDQQRLVPLVNGRRSVRDLVEESGLVEFSVGKALFGLAQAGLIIPDGRRETEARVPRARTRIQEHHNLGIAFYSAGMYAEAEREFASVVELEPHQPDARFRLALTALRTGDDRTAVRHFKRLIEVIGSRPAALHGMALALERMGRLDAALAATDAATDAANLRPEGARDAFGLSRGILLTKAGRFVEAVAAFDLHGEPEDENQVAPEAFFVFAPLAKAGAGRMDAALETARTGARLYPRSAPVALHLGMLYEHRGDHDAAEQWYERAVEEDVTLSRAHKACGDARYRRGAYEAARASYEDVLRLEQDAGGDVYFKLGNIHYREMRREAAVSCWRKALTLDPANVTLRTNLELVEKVL